MPLKLNHEDYDQLTVIALQGDLTDEGVDDFRRVSIERVDHDIRDFVLDLSETEFVDSRGLESLVWLQELAAERLGQVRLACTTENVCKILELTRLAGRFDAHPDVDTAIKSLR